MSHLPLFTFLVLLSLYDLGLEEEGLDMMDRMTEFDDRKLRERQVTIHASFVPRVSQNAKSILLDCASRYIESGYLSPRRRRHRPDVFFGPSGTSFCHLQSWIEHSSKCDNAYARFRMDLVRQDYEQYDCPRSSEQPPYQRSGLSPFSKPNYGSTECTIPESKWIIQRGRPRSTYGSDVLSGYILQKAWLHLGVIL